MRPNSECQRVYESSHLMVESSLSQMQPYTITQTKPTPNLTSKQQIPIAQTPEHQHHTQQQPKDQVLNESRSPKEAQIVGWKNIAQDFSKQPRKQLSNHSQNNIIDKQFKIKQSQSESYVQAGLDERVGQEAIISTPTSTHRDYSIQPHQQQRSILTQNELVQPQQNYYRKDIILQQDELVKQSRTHYLPGNPFLSQTKPTDKLNQLVLMIKQSGTIAVISKHQSWLQNFLTMILHNLDIYEYQIREGLVKLIKNIQLVSFINQAKFMRLFPSINHITNCISRTLQEYDIWKLFKNYSNSFGSSIQHRQDFIQYFAELNKLSIHPNDKKMLDCLTLSASPTNTRYFQNIQNQQSDVISCLGCAQFFTYNRMIYYDQRKGVPVYCLGSIEMQQHQKNELVKVVCGLLNTGGGFILFGIKQQRIDGCLMAEPMMEQYTKTVMILMQNIQQLDSQMQHKIEINYLPVQQSSFSDPRVRFLIGRYIARIKVYPKGSSKLYFVRQNNDLSCYMYRDNAALKIKHKEIRKLIKRKLNNLQEAGDLDEILLKLPSSNFNHNCGLPQNVAAVQVQQQFGQTYERLKKEYADLSYLIYKIEKT